MQTLTPISERTRSGDGSASARSSVASHLAEMAEHMSAEAGFPARDWDEEHWGESVMYEVMRLRSFMTLQLENLEIVIERHAGESVTKREPGFYETGVATRQSDVKQQSEVTSRLEKQLESIKATLEFVNSDLMVQYDRGAHERELLKQELTDRFDNRVAMLEDQLGGQIRGFDAKLQVLMEQLNDRSKDIVSLFDHVAAAKGVLQQDDGKDASQADMSSWQQEIKSEVLSLSRRQEVLEKEVSTTNIEHLLAQVRTAQDNLSTLEDSLWSTKIVRLPSLSADVGSLTKRVEILEQDGPGRRLHEIEASLTTVLNCVSSICDKMSVVDSTSAAVKRAAGTSNPGKPLSQTFEMLTKNNTENTLSSISEDADGLATKQQEDMDAMLKNNTETRNNVSLLAEATAAMDLRLTQVEKHLWKYKLRSSGLSLPDTPQTSLVQPVQEPTRMLSVPMLGVRDSMLSKVPIPPLELSPLLNRPPKESSQYPRGLEPSPLQSRSPKESPQYPKEASHYQQQGNVQIRLPPNFNDQPLQKEQTQGSNNRWGPPSDRQAAIKSPPARWHQGCRSIFRPPSRCKPRPTSLGSDSDGMSRSLSPDLPTPAVMSRSAACPSGFRRPDTVPAVDLVRLKSADRLPNTSVVTTPVTVSSCEVPVAAPPVDDIISDKRKVTGSRARSPQQQARKSSSASSPCLQKPLVSLSPRQSTERRVLLAQKTHGGHTPRTDSSPRKEAAPACRSAEQLRSQRTIHIKPPSASPSAQSRTTGLSSRSVHTLGRA